MEGCSASFPFDNKLNLYFNTFGSKDKKRLLQIAYLTKAHNVRSSNTFYDVLAMDNKNLSASQKELREWHFKLGHFHCQ